MSQFRGRASIAGVTASSLGNAFAGMQFKSNDLVFQQGYFGYSITTLTTGQTWHILVFETTTSGDKRTIAGISGLNAAGSGFIPIVDARGATQVNFIGIPRPTGVDVIGSSAGIGITFSGSVTAILHNP